MAVHQRLTVHLVVLPEYLSLWVLVGGEAPGGGTLLIESYSLSYCIMYHPYSPRRGPNIIRKRFASCYDSSFSRVVHDNARIQIA